VDVEAFEEAAASARRVRDPAAYRVAIELYAGDLLPGDRYEGWAEVRREELRRLYLALLVEFGDLCEVRNEHQAALEALRRVAEESTLEEAHAGLIRLYTLSDRRTQALSSIRTAAGGPFGEARHGAQRFDPSPVQRDSSR
jgi:two-component SAPR family response regulator